MKQDTVFKVRFIKAAKDFFVKRFTKRLLANAKELMLKKSLVVLLLVLNVSHVFAAGMSQQQILALLDAGSRHFENGNRAIQIGDKDTACLEGKEAERLFVQIDPKDVAPEHRTYYNQLREVIIGAVNAMKQVC
jgi:hypothetical protein